MGYAGTEDTPVIKIDEGIRNPHNHEDQYFIV
jgi:hypothetical protein